MAQLKSKPNVPAGHRGLGLLVLGLFFFSGACGLTYEILWTRALRLVMGNTVFSITTVLCAFMGGLALGSLVGGRIIDRRKDPLRIYALLEGAIGLYCLAFPWLLGAAEPVYRLAYEHFQGSFYTLSLIRFFFCGLVLIVPTTLMGATLPILGKFLIRNPQGLAWRIGQLYALNTFGAVLGAALAGLFLLPAVGVSKTLYSACAVNLLISAAGLALHRKIGSQEPAQVTEDLALAEQPAPDESVSTVLRWCLLIGYGLSGFAAMVYEVAWSRLLSLVVGSTVYAFSLMLIAFILGLALGGMVYRWLLDRRKDPVFALAAVEVGIGLSALAVVPILGQMPAWIVPVIKANADSFFMVQLTEFGIIFALMLIPTTLMGAAFPLASRIYASGVRAIGRSIGNLYASNTLGAILGSAAAGFLLVPLLGIQRTTLAGVLLNVLLGCGFLFFARPRLAFKMVASAVLLAGVVGSLIWLPAWDRRALSSGPYRNFALLSSPQFKDVNSAVLFHEEGIGTTVAVFEVGKVRTLTVNGKPDASNSMDMPTQKLLAHLPLLLHEEPRNALIIGLGSGITLGSACRHPLESVDCVEICPAVIRASQYFREWNYDALSDARVHMIVEDGRNHLLLSGRTYDVIISEPSNPYIAGVADLFTREFYQLCRNRLKPNGIVCAWTHTYNMAPEAFASIVRSFGAVFPHATMWESGPGDYLLIGTQGPLSVDVERLAERMALPEIAADLAKVELKSVPDFLSNLALREDAIAEFAGNAPLHTDDNALLEFAAPLGLYGPDTAYAMVQKLYPLWGRPIDFLKASPAGQARLRELQQMADKFTQARRLALRGQVGANQEMILDYKAAFALNPDDRHLSTMLWYWRQDCRRLLAAQSFARAREEADRLLSIAPADPEASGFMAAALAGEGKPDEGETYLARAVQLAPESFDGHCYYAMWLSKQGKPAKAIEQYAEAARIDPSQVEVRTVLTELLLAAGKRDDALPHLAQACKLSPDDDGLRATYAQALDAAGMDAQAVEQYRLLLRHKSESVETANNLAWLLAVSRDASVRNGPEALKLAMKLPDDAGMLDTLAAAYAQAGQYPQAIATAERAFAMASRGGMASLAKEIEFHLQLYRQGRPFIRP